MCADQVHDSRHNAASGAQLQGLLSSLQMIAIDLDGTLVDSVSDLHHAVNVMRSEQSLSPVPESAVREWVGNGIDRLVHRALTDSLHGEADEERFVVAAASFRRAYADVLGRHSQLYPGVQEGLAWLQTLSLPLVVVTNKDGRFSERLLQQLGIRHHFAYLIGGDDVSARKPDPEGLLLAAERCGARASNSLLLGDSVSDFLAARAAGFHSVGLRYGYNHGQPIDTLPAHQAPDALIDSFLALPALLS